MLASMLPVPLGRGRSKPSPYPLLVFHVLRLAQLLSALICMSILSYFVWHLRDEHYPVPWTFIFVCSLSVSLMPLTAASHVCAIILGLLAASTFAIPIFFLSQYIHITAPHHAPKRSLLLNIPLSVIWLLGLALLTWNLSYTLGHHCSIQQWKNEAGIMVCRMYKALTTFAVTGAASTLASALLDWRVWHAQGAARGGYGMMRLPDQYGGGSARRNISTDGMDKSPALGFDRSPANEHPANNLWGDSTTATPDGFAAVHSSAGKQGEQRAGVRVGALWDSESRGLTRPWKANRTIEVEDFGYKVPEEQTTYGAGGERGASMDICER